MGIVIIEREPVCLHCGEPIVMGEDRSAVFTLYPLHYECAVRLCVGSVGHQEGRCPCFGGTFEDPPGLPPRQAAIAASTLHQVRRAWPRRN